MSKHLPNTQTADDAFAETLRAILNHGDKIVAGESKSTGSGKETKEILNFTQTIDDPKTKVTLNPRRKLNIPAAVARFLWIMAGSDRLADIAFYEPRVSFFSDDGISVPGSSYGHRILRPRPGLNQLKAVINRLRKDKYSRRAAIAIYQAEDAVRESHDIPCAFGIFYHIREDQLHATTVMRSNNAFTLMPYNVFEFGLLAEVVAAELDVPLGSLTHSALSMHIYKDDYEAAAAALKEYDESKPSSADFLDIPNEPSPLDEIQKLIILEAGIRHGSQGLTGSNIEEWINKGQEKLDPYWAQLYYLLLLYVVQRKNIHLQNDPSDRQLALDSLQSVIQDPWLDLLPENTFVVSDSENTEDISQLELPLFSSNEKIVPLVGTKAHKQLREITGKYELAKNDQVSWQEFVMLEERFAVKLAARQGDELTVKQVNEVLKEFRSK